MSINATFIIITHFDKNGLEVYVGEEGVETKNQDEAYGFESETDAHIHMRSVSGISKERYIVEQVHRPKIINRTWTT